MGIFLDGSIRNLVPQHELSLHRPIDEPNFLASQVVVILSRVVYFQPLEKTEKVFSLYTIFHVEYVVSLLIPRSPVTVNLGLPLKLVIPHNLLDVILVIFNCCIG